MFVVTPTERPAASLPGLTHFTVAGAADGQRQLSVWRQCIAAGQATPPHRHDCEEVVFIDTGAGELHMGGEVHAFRAGQVLLVPRDASHQIINTGDEAVWLSAVFAMTPVAATTPDGELMPLPWLS